MGENRKLIKEIQATRDKLRVLEESIVDNLRGVGESMARMQVLLQMPLRTVESSKTELLALNSETNTSSNIPTPYILIDSIIIATSTGTSSSILPSDEPNLDTTTTSNSNDIGNNDKDNSNILPNTLLTIYLTCLIL